MNPMSYLTSMSHFAVHAVLQTFHILLPIPTELSDFIVCYTGYFSIPHPTHPLTHLYTPFTSSLKASIIVA